MHAGAPTLGGAELLLESPIDFLPPLLVATVLMRKVRTSLARPCVT
jgi:hypothetical protein